MLNTKETIESRLLEAHDALKASHVAAEAATSDHNEANVALLQTKAAIYLEHAADPKGLGGNEAARAARVDEMTASLAKAARLAEDELRRAKLAVTLAVCDWTLAKELNALFGAEVTA